MYTLDHLATFSCGSNQGLHHPLDAINKLRLLEKSSGIWTQRMKIKLEKKDLSICSYEDGATMEKFSLSKVLEPTAVITEDPNEIYNNILMFTVLQDSSKKKNLIPLSEIHLFQCISVSAQEIVDEVNRLKSGAKYKKIPKSYYVPPQQYASKSMLNINELGNGKSNNHLHNQSFSGAISPQFMDYNQNYSFNGIPQNHTNGKAFSSSQSNKEYPIPPRESLYSYSSHDIDGAESVASQQTEHDVMMLNHCFDDIENFIAKLQHSNAALKELEKRQKMGSKKNKNMPGSGVLSLRARPPTESEFIDILQKFKLAFNLLARLKNYIHDPNAPELIHFLFTPLAMIVEASKRTNYGADLTQHIVTPLLTNRAVDLLQSCLTSKETDLWQSLGEAWIYPQDHFRGYPASFSPIFCDGWQPHYEMNDLDRISVIGSFRNGRGNNESSPPARRQLVRDHQGLTHDNPQHRSFDGSAVKGDELGGRGAYRFHSPSRPLPNHPISPPPLPPTQPNYPDRLGLILANNMHGTKAPASYYSPPRNDFSHLDIGNGFHGSSFGTSSDFEKQKRFLDYLKETRSKAYEVMFDRVSKHEKELSVRKGEVLQILDDSRNWWKARNFNDEIGFVPYTILRPYSYV